MYPNPKYNPKTNTNHNEAYKCDMEFPVVPCGSAANSVNS